MSSFAFGSAVKHDTFVYSRSGERVLFWDRSYNNLQDWTTDNRDAVEAEGLYHAAPRPTWRGPRWRLRSHK